MENNNSMAYFSLDPSKYLYQKDQELLISNLGSNH
jgi:hypothetical protein